MNKPSFSQVSPELGYTEKREALAWMNEPYNGHKNWHTWNVILWLGNSEESYHAVANKNALEIENYVRQIGLKGDGFTLSKVHWEDVAASFKE